MIDRYVNTEELRRLAASLVVVLGDVMIFVLFAFIVVPGLRNANKPQTSPSGSPQIGETGWLDPTEFPPQKSYEIPPVDPETVLVASRGISHDILEFFARVPTTLSLHWQLR